MGEIKLSEDQPAPQECESRCSTFSPCETTLWSALF